MEIGPENKRCGCEGKPRLRVVWKADCGCAGLTCPKCGKEYEYYCAPHLLLRADLGVADGYSQASLPENLGGV